jgi:glutathionylspermidine synthase
MDILIKEKLAKLDLSKSDDIEKTIKLVDMSYDNKYKIFTKVIDIFKSNITKRTSDGTISKVEVDVFNILLAKRNKEKEAFLNEKTSSFNKIYEKLNASKKISEGIPKTQAMVKEISSSTREYDASTLFEDNIPSEAPLSDEFLNIVKEVLDLFS